MNCRIEVGYWSPGGTRKGWKGSNEEWSPGRCYQSKDKGLVESGKGQNPENDNKKDGLRKKDGREPYEKKNHDYTIELPVEESVTLNMFDNFRRKSFEIREVK